mmetsp:Transcript_66905/g.157702  ORF Transcript_66905/g.157702 Transcript_66905/m.157702 type:complete len:278 (+) Transcript_66905:38-871(+)
MGVARSPLRAWCHCSRLIGVIGALGITGVCRLGLPACGTVPSPRLMLVTGASKGLGAEVVRHFALSTSWRVAALSRDQSSLKKLGSTSDNILPVVCDVSNHSSLSEAVSLACEHFGCQPYALINNAAVYENKPFHKFDTDDIDSLIGTNLKGAIYATRQVLPAMLQAGAGRIIFINSVAGLPTWTIPGESLYSATKHGLSGFADSLANELKGSGVQVTSIHPGGIDTPLQVAAGASAEMRKKFLKSSDVVACISHVLEADPGILYKRIEVFGSSFWH